MMLLEEEVAQRIEYGSIFVNFDSAYFMRSVCKENVGSCIYRLMCKVSEPLALLVSVYGKNNEISFSLSLGYFGEIRPGCGFDYENPEHRV